LWKTKKTKMYNKENRICKFFDNYLRKKTLPKSLTSRDVSYEI